MCSHRVSLLAAAALIGLVAPHARADSGWSGAAHAGLAFTRQQGATVTSGGWVDLLHTFVPNASIGVEAGYLEVSTNSNSVYTLEPRYGYGGTSDNSLGMVSASAALKLRGVGPASAHVIGTFGYYHFTDNPNAVEHEWNPGFSLGLGFSAAGLVRPSFQLRWHETIGPDNANLDVVTFEAGLHFD